MASEKVLNYIDSIKRILQRIRYSRRKITCPHCYNRFLPYEAHFRCQNNNCPGEVDDKIDGSPILQHAFPVDLNKWYKRFFIPLKEKCHGTIKTTSGDKDACGKVSSFRICPFCHNKLFLDAGLVKPLVIAIVGGQGSSKSHYIVELFRRIKNAINTIGINEDITVGGNSKDFWDAFKKVNSDPPSVLETTQDAVRYHFTLNFRDSTVLLTFYDNPGENWEISSHEDQITNLTRYIANADGIIVLIDLLEFENCRIKIRNLGKPLPADKVDKKGYFQSTILYRIYLEAKKILSINKVNKPVAVCITKIDELKTDFSDNPTLYRLIFNKTVDTNPYNLNEQRQISEGMEKKLKQWEKDILSTCNSYFSSAEYFAVAPTGCRPDSNKKLGDYSPIRVEDPFLWILYKLKLLPGDEPGNGRGFA